MSYDVKCQDLAKDFLGDESPSPQRIAELAQVIQDAIEGWLEANSLENMTSATNDVRG